MLDGGWSDENLQPRLNHLWYYLSHQAQDAGKTALKLNQQQQLTNNTSRFCLRVDSNNIKLSTLQTGCLDVSRSSESQPLDLPKNHQIIPKRPTRRPKTSQNPLHQTHRWGASHQSRLPTRSRPSPKGVHLRGYQPERFPPTNIIRWCLLKPQNDPKRQRPGRCKQKCLEKKNESTAQITVLNQLSTLVARKGDGSNILRKACGFHVLGLSLGPMAQK